MRLLCLLFLSAITATTAAAREWQPKFVTSTYAVSGTTPIELYESIGANGPVIGGGRRTIAVTEWDLKWRRDYQSEGSACVLKSALPFLTVTYRLPKPKTKLDGEAAVRWAAFSDGIAAHEAVHGQDIVLMTEEIIASTVSLRVEDDAGCVKIRAEVLRRVKAANEAYKTKARAFDQVEMSKNGNVQQLILRLVNG